MKIVLTGSVGNITKPLTEMLVARGHEVKVITSNPKNASVIQGLGAGPLIGKLEDGKFLKSAFAGADAVYCMIPLNFTATDQKSYYEKIGNNYVDAVRANNIRKVALLTGWAGSVIDTYNVEELIKGMGEINVSEIRPTIFYTNFFMNIDMMKGKGFLGSLLALRFYGPIGWLKGRRGLIVSTYGGNDKIALVAPADIAAAVAEELESTVPGRTIRYAASEEMTCSEAATILGKAIGKPYLKWAIIPEKQFLNAIVKAGVSKALASDLVKMQAATHSGEIYREYQKHHPKLGTHKLEAFAKELAKAYRQSV